MSALAALLLVAQPAAQPSHQQGCGHPLYKASNRNARKKGLYSVFFYARFNVTICGPLSGIHTITLPCSHPSNVTI